MKVKTAWDLLTASARRWSGEISVMLRPRSRAPRSLSRASFAHEKKKKITSVHRLTQTCNSAFFFFSFHL